MKSFLSIKTLLVSLVLLGGCGDERIIAVGGGALPDSFALADGAVLADGEKYADAEEMTREIILLHDLSVPEQVIVTQELPIRAKLLDYELDGPASNALVQYTIVENDGEGDATLSTLQMLTNIEAKLEELLSTIDSMPKDEVEAEALLPLSLAGPQTAVVMAGDPKQLGPSTFSSVDSVHGLHTSLMERLLAMPLYTSDAANRASMHLTNNYRSHPELATLLV